MIKFFRKIRYNLMETGKTGKPALPAGRYFKYAIGEIILVVIGILIALAINNWNQNRIKIVQERDDLENLKEEIQTNIVDFKSLDSLYATFEKKTAYGLKLFNDNPNVEDFIQIDTLIVTQLKVFPLTSSTYDEMLNTGKFYNLKNKTLKTKITRFYAEANNYSLAFIQINNSVINIANLPDLFRYGLLRDRLKTKPIHIKDIDTTWVHNVNAPTYLAFYKSANYIQGFSNTSRRELMARQILVCKELVKLIDSELERKI